MFVISQVNPAAVHSPPSALQVIGSTGEIDRNIKSIMIGTFLFLKMFGNSNEVIKGFLRQLLNYCLGCFVGSCLGSSLGSSLGGCLGGCLSDTLNSSSADV